MKLTKNEVEVFRNDFKKTPLHVLAQRRQCTVIDRCAAVRRGGYALDAQPIEIQFIVDEIESQPAEAIRTALGMTKSQFLQILMRFDLRASTGADCLYPDEVIAKTRWLFEKRFCWKIDDDLPRLVQNKHFVSNKLGNLIGYAVEQKERDERFMGFPDGQRRDRGCRARVEVLLGGSRESSLGAGWREAVCAEEASGAVG